MLKYHHSLNLPYQVNTMNEEIKNSLFVDMFILYVIIPWIFMLCPGDTGTTEHKWRHYKREVVTHIVNNLFQSSNKKVQLHMTNCFNC